MIFFIDPNRRKEKCDVIFDIILDISGVTKEQLKSRTRKGEILFMRQLFQYGFMNTGMGTLRAAGLETNRSHCAVLNSIRIVENCIEVDNGWRKKVCDEFIKKLEL